MPNSLLYIACLILGGVGAWLVVKFGFKLGIVDVPNERSSHTQPIPKGGGIGILAAFVLSSLLLSIPSGFWLPATALALVSFYGDRSGLSAKFRLPIQFSAASVFLLTGLLCNSPPVFYSPTFSLFFPGTLLWVIFLAVFMVGTANIYNFMDGINGIAGITGTIGFGLLAYFARTSGAASSFVTLAICMSIACIGFLPFNMPRAKVFMGDVGSILLGFAFAGMVVLISKSFLDFFCLAAFLFPFYADELTTMYVRLRDRENLTCPHRKHLYQLLANELEVPHWKVSMGYGFVQLFVGTSILLIKNIGCIAVISILAIYFCGFAGLTYVIRKKLG